MIRIILFFLFAVPFIGASAQSTSIQQNNPFPSLQFPVVVNMSTELSEVANIQSHITDQKISDKNKSRTAAAGYPLVIKNVTIIDGTGADPVPRQTIIIRNSIIESIFDTGTGGDS